MNNEANNASQNANAEEFAYMPRTSNYDHTEPFTKVRVVAKTKNSITVRSRHHNDSTYDTTFTLRKDHGWVEAGKKPYESQWVKTLVVGEGAAAKAEQENAEWRQRREARNARRDAVAALEKALAGHRCGNGNYHLSDEQLAKINELTAALAQ